MRVHDAEAANDAGSQQFHVTGKDDEVGLERSDAFRHGVVESRAVGVIGQLHGPHGYARLLRALLGEGGRPVRSDGDDTRRKVRGTARVKDGLQRRAGS